MSGAQIIKCRRGDPCNFVVEIEGGLDDAYTQAIFRARDDWDESLPALIDIDESAMTFDRTDPDLGKVTIEIGATLTADLPVTKQPRIVAALLRLVNPTDADDRLGFEIPFQLQPDV
jgi:hypothetical protein